MVGKYLIMATLLGSGGGSSGSGGSAGVSPKEVNFYDYDGTCVHAYTVAEAQALSDLPAGPEHPGLVFQGWNWSLDGVKGLTRAMNIGAMYTTDDGTTRLYITLQEGRTSPMLGVGVKGTVTVDWGDGTEPDVLTGTSTSTTVWTPNHAYAAPGDYVIRLTVDGEMVFTGSSASNAYSSILRYSSSADARNMLYQSTLQSVEIGSGVTVIGNNAFSRCGSLTSVIIPKSVTAINDAAFDSCYALKSVILPDSVKSISYDGFRRCYTIASVILHDSITLIDGTAFYDCYNLKTVILPDSITTMRNNPFYECGITSVTIPKGMTQIAGVFYNCRSIAYVVIHAAVTKIGATAFGNSTGVGYYDFTSHTAVPTLAATSAFTDIPADCEIRVPAALYDEWIAATNWATYASQIKAY